MKNMKQTAFIFQSILLIFLLTPAILFSQQLSTPYVLSSNMVLQHGNHIPVWGKSRPHERIQVSFGKQRLQTKADTEGKWHVEFSPMAVNKTPQTLTIKGKDSTIVYENILVGDVWLCSGQSNMEYTMRLNRKFAPPARGKDVAAQELEKPANPMIRLFIAQRWNEPSAWEVADSNSLALFSAPGYFFGKAIQEKLDIPVGLIRAAVGGTRIEEWTPGEVYLQSPVFAEQMRSDGKVGGLEPGERYQHQIAPLLPFSIKGVIWYQGENNCGVGERQYAEKFEVMVDAWRKAFKLPDIPFYSVLLSPFSYSGGRGYKGPFTAEELPLFREQQIRAKELVSNSDFIVVSDLTDNVQDIHPSYKWEVGARLARVALAKEYGFADIVWSGPRLAQKEIKEGTIVLSFEHVGDGLKTNNRNRFLDWFEIAGEDGCFRPAIARIKDKDKVVVYHPEIKQPRQVRFGWHEVAKPNLVNSEDLPAVPFRE